MSQRRVLQGRPGPGRRGRGRAGAQPLTCRPRAAARSVRTVPERPDALRTGGGRAVGEAAEHRDAAGRRYGTGRWGRLWVPGAAPGASPGAAAVLSVLFRAPLSGRGLAAPFCSKETFSARSASSARPRPRVRDAGTAMQCGSPGAGGSAERHAARARGTAVR